MILKIMLAQGHTSTGLMTHELISFLAIYLVPKVRLKIHTHAWLNWLQKSSTIKTDRTQDRAKERGIRHTFRKPGSAVTMTEEAIIRTDVRTYSNHVVTKLGKLERENCR
jgi:hypothetical protein